MKILDCSNYKSALISASNVLSLSQERLIEILKQIQDTRDVSDYHHQCFSELLQYLKYEPTKLTSHWFHGTRIIDINSYFENGLMPKTEGYKILTPFLKDLAKNIEHSKQQSSIFELSKLGKELLGQDDEGPFATLFKQKAQDKNYHFTQCPEAVEDIAEDLVGANFHLITESFMQVTRPALIELIGSADETTLENTLYYLHQVIHGESEHDTARRIDAFFMGNGETIPSEKIKTVHFLDNSEIVQNMNFAIPSQ